MRTHTLRVVGTTALAGAAFGRTAPACAQHPTSAIERAASWADHQTMAQASYFRSLAWRAVGPVKTGARVEAIAIPPGNTGTIYVGVGSGNLWKTVNNGLTWRPIFEHQSSFAIGDVAVAHSNPNVVWVGTGEAQPRFAGYAYPGTGVFKSTNGGDSFTPMGLAETQHIGKVLIDPTNANVVYVAAMGRQWTPNAERGVFRTRDGGVHWQKVLFINDSTGVIDVAMDPVNPLVLYAWAWQIDEGRHGGLFKSTDGGDHWRHITAGLPTGLLGRANIGVAPTKGKVVYAYLDNRAPTTVKGRPYVGGEVYRSDDRGEHWRKVNTQDVYDVFGIYGWKFADVHVDPTNANHVYILGNHGFQSNDGGATWRQFGVEILRVHDTDGRALHLDQHELVIDPSNPSRVLLGNDGGLFMSYDGGDSWLHLNNIPVSQMYFVSTDNRTPYRIFAGTQDDAAVYGPSTASLDDAVPDVWRSVYLDPWTGGDSYVTLPDPTDDRIVYYEHQNGGMLRMDLTGASVLSHGPSTVDIAPRAPKGQPEIAFSWYTPFFISPFDARTLYAGGNQVLKSTDRGDSWTVISPNLGDKPGGDRELVTTGALTMLTESPLVRGVIAGGTEGGQIWLTMNDGGSWHHIDTGLPRHWTSRVTLSSHDAGTIYVSFTAFREDDARPYVFVSNDTGHTWRSIAGNLPLQAVNVIKDDPDAAGMLYVGTDLGAYVSRDNGAHWESLSATLASTAVMDLTIQRRDHDLVAATYGRGAWILDLDPVRDRTVVSKEQPLHLYPIRDVVADWFGWEAMQSDRRGRNVARVQLAASGTDTVSVAVRDSTGREVRQWTATVTHGVNTLIWDLQADIPNRGLRDAKPGRYTVEVRQGAARVTGQITVLDDPKLQKN